MPQYITKEGLQKLKDELNELKTKEMRRIVKLIAEAAAFETPLLVTLDYNYIESFRKPIRIIQTPQ